MESALTTLKTQLYAYRDIEKRLTDIGRDVSELRDQRKQIEKCMATILARPEFQEFKKLELKDDGTFVNIQRPGEWNKPWSLGKKDLETSLHEYFSNGNTYTAKDCYEFICNKQKDKMVGKEFVFDVMDPKKK